MELNILIISIIAFNFSPQKYKILYHILMTFPVPKPFQLWRNFASQVRRVFNNLQTKTIHPPPPTAKVRIRSTTTPEPELQFYGALNPIYQTGNF